MNNEEIKILQHAAIDLLKKLIAITSFSKEEDKTASAIEHFYNQKMYQQKDFSIIFGQRINIMVKQNQLFFLIPITIQ